MRDDRGRFLPGPDDDRHVFSLRECRKGYELATRFYKLSSRRKVWLRRKITGYYCRKQQGKVVVCGR